MGKGLTRLIGFGFLLKAFAFMPLEANCPTTKGQLESDMYKYQIQKKYEDNASGTTNLKKYNEYFQLWKED